LINWNTLSLNESPDAIEMLGANPTKINWYNLSRNPSAMPIIRENLDRYCWETGFYRSVRKDLLDEPLL
jgi:hypothetical protein